MARAERNASAHETRHWVRPFGESLSDLELDFATSPRADLVDGVLSSCLSKAGLASEAKLRIWTLDERLRSLVDVAVSTLGPALDFYLDCGARNCRETMELSVDLQQFVTRETRRDEHDAVRCVIEAGPTLTLRLPTGADQARWAETLPSDVEMARELVVEVDGAPPEDGFGLSEGWLAAIASALSEADPLSDLELRTSCPNCGQAVAVELDLEAELLRRLASTQPALLDEIHCLARAYHWNEAEIMALPRWRRADYLRRIQLGGAP